MILETSTITEIMKEMGIISMYIITVLKQQDARTIFTDHTTETTIRTGMKVMAIGIGMMQQTSICRLIEDDPKNRKESHFRRGILRMITENMRPLIRESEKQSGMTSAHL